jgi:hypothetical protein
MRSPRASFVPGAYPWEKRDLTYSQNLRTQDMRFLGLVLQSGWSNALDSCGLPSIMGGTSPNYHGTTLIVAQRFHV